MYVVSVSEPMLPRGVILRRVPEFRGQGVIVTARQFTPVGCFTMVVWWKGAMQGICFSPHSFPLPRTLQHHLANGYWCAREARVPNVVEGEACLARPPSRFTGSHPTFRAALSRANQMEFALGWCVLFLINAAERTAHLEKFVGTSPGVVTLLATSLWAKSTVAD